MKKKPIIGITMGDPAGIGPEIAVKVFNHNNLHRFCRPLLVGDARVIRDAASRSGFALDVHAITRTADAGFSPGTIDVYDLHHVDLARLEIGRISALAGDAAFTTVKKVIELALAREIDATVTGPIQKEAIHLAGHVFSGHTEIYAHFTQTRKYAMLLVHGRLRVIHVSTHVSLRQACEAVKKERILEVTGLLSDSCRQFGIANPRIAVAGLNPHAGDGGLFGDEEIREIVPAVQAAREQGYAVEGPIPADTVFSKARGGMYDGVVAMYHDQGHIPFKLFGFEWDHRNQRMKHVRGVNITLGLPIIRTSVDHGTALEIAGKGIASADALYLAIKYAAQLANAKAVKK